MKQYRVTNLSTGEERTYDRSGPKEAVIRAWLDDHEKDEQPVVPHIEEGERTVAFGDWCSLKIQTEEA